jgi:hypothetical protein
MKTVVAVVLISISLSACSSGNSKTAAATPGDRQSSTVSLTSDEKHQLYSAALAATESPLESEIFRTACQRIGIFNAGGTPNDNYLPFVSAHVDWALSTESQQFKLEISTRGKAQDYVAQHLPR